ncbi:iron regulated 1 [Actinidia rufa]|uniref:Solute carrier family 40 member n=1 Tax=Actinidia rufa TaxID=165716 RepID=A0A7J0DPA0_9ERIC|nr:iron regulated 1 [Actinidia rufa]
MWEFSIGLYMIHVFPNSLLLPAVYGVVESASTALFAPVVGQLVDSLTYVKVYSDLYPFVHRTLLENSETYSNVLRFWLLTQNLSFIVAGGTVIALLVYADLKCTNFMAFMSLVILTNVSGAAGVLSTLTGTILIEREWVVVISEGHPPEVLTKINSIIRRIDLICKLLAPAVSGCIISFVSLTASALVLSLWNSISICLVYWLLTSVYNGIPSLHEMNQKRVSRLPPMLEESPSTHQEKISLLSEARNDSDFSENSWKRKIIKRIFKNSYVSVWRVYFQQDVVLPGVALALLYFTFWNSNDCYIRVGGYTCIYYRYCTRSKCHDRNSCNISLSYLPGSDFNTSNGTLVDLVSVDLPLSVCSFNMGAKQPYISICADGWSRFITAWTMDV